VNTFIFSEEGRETLITALNVNVYHNYTHHKKALYRIQNAAIQILKLWKQIMNCARGISTVLKECFKKNNFSFNLHALDVIQ
jgi:hypothetical protein